MAIENLQKLIFIYNADSGFRNMIVDVTHKILSPKTYPCSLCGITYGVFTEKKAWKKFRRRANLEMEFLHKDEFLERYASKFGYKFTFPIVLCTEGTNLEVFMGTAALNEIVSTEDFIEQLKSSMQL